MMYPDFLSSRFTASETKLSGSLLKTYSVECQWNPSRFAGGRVCLVLDRSAETQANEKCWGVAWAPLSAFVNGPPAIGDRFILNPGGLTTDGTVELQVARLLPAEDASVRLALVIAPKVAP